MKVQSVIINWEEHEVGWWEVYTAWYNIEISNDNVISTLRQPDHYLWHWNAIQWQSPDFLETAPYDYNAWDYYIVNKTADMSWTNRIAMLWGEYHIPSLDEINKIESNEKAAEVIYNITNYHIGICEVWILIPSNPEDSNLDLNLWASNWCYGARESDGTYGFDVDTANKMPQITNWSLYQVLAFKDEPVIPDNTWSDLWDDVYYNASLWLYSVQVWEDEWITFKDKVEWATTSWWKWNLYQRWNCNPINVNEYEINTNEIDYSQIQPSTYSSNKITPTHDLFVNADDAWWFVTDTAAAMRWPCPEWYIVPDSPEMYLIWAAYINWYTWSTQDIMNLPISGLLMQFLVNQEYDSWPYIWSVVQQKYSPIDPTWLEWRVKIHEEDLWSMWVEIYWNEDQWLISVWTTSNWVAQDRTTFKDKLLWATEIFDSVGEYLEKWYITLNKAKLWNQYNWWNNYAFDLFWDESIKIIIDSDTDFVAELQSKAPYWYNWSIVLFILMWGWWWWYSSTKAAPLKTSWESAWFWASIFSANPNLWDYVEVQHNLRPLWTEYVEDPSTDSEIENERVDINDIYLYDWTQWLLIWNHVVPHVFVTQSEYDAISDKKYSNWTLYLFVDHHPWEDNCDWMYEYDYFYNLWDEWSGGKKVSSIHPSDYSYCKDYIVAELNSKPMCYYNKFSEENKLVAWSIPTPSPKSWDTKAISNTSVRFLWTEESWWEVNTRSAYLDYVETHDDACDCDDCTYRFYTIDWSQWFAYNSYCGNDSAV